MKQLVELQAYLTSSKSTGIPSLLSRLLSQQPKIARYSKQPCEDVVSDMRKYQAELSDIARIVVISLVSSFKC